MQMDFFFYYIGETLKIGKAGGDITFSFII